PPRGAVGAGAGRFLPRAAGGAGRRERKQTGSRPPPGGASIPACGRRAASRCPRWWRSSWRWRSSATPRARSASCRSTRPRRSAQRRARRWVAADAQPAGELVGAAPVREVPELQVLAHYPSLVAQLGQIGSCTVDRLACAERSQLHGVVLRLAPVARSASAVVDVALGTVASAPPG